MRNRLVAEYKVYNEDKLVFIEEYEANRESEFFVKEMLAMGCTKEEIYELLFGTSDEESCFAN